MSTSAATEVDNTTAGWREVMNKFSSKVDGLEEKMKSLIREREGLLLDAELGLNGAAKKLQKVDEEIAAVRRDCQTTREAIVQAQQRHDAARAAEAAEAEKARKKEMAALAGTAMVHAQEFTAAMNQVVAAGSSLRLVVRNILQRATKDERTMISHLLESRPYTLAAEAAGLRSYVEFAPYPGPREQIRSLDQELPVFLGRWLKAEKEGE